MTKKMNAKRIQERGAEEENKKKENCITVGSNVMVGKFPCKVLSIVEDEDDGINYYEVKPMEFETFSRFVTADSIEIRDDDDE